MIICFNICHYVLDQPFEVQFVELNATSEALLNYVQLGLRLRLKICTLGENQGTKLSLMLFKNVYFKSKE